MGIQSVFYTSNLAAFTERDLAEGQIRQGPGPNGEMGWVTDPPNALSPDCEPVDGTCACGRSAA
jgi:hypothetical protein